MRAIGTPGQRGGIPTRARERIGWLQPPSIRDDRPRPVQRRVGGCRGAHEPTKRGGYQLRPRKCGAPNVCAVHTHGQDDRDCDVEILVV